MFVSIQAPLAEKKLRAGFFLAPIFLSMEIYPPSIRHILVFNPMTLVIDMAHNIVLYNHMPSVGAFGYLGVVSLAILGLGYVIFKKFESKAIEIV